MTQSPKPTGQVRSLDALTGLRFVAALFVFIEHAQLHFPTEGIRLNAVGGTAVAFFYVLSGFILTYVYQGRLDRRGIGKFYYTRWARIWPLHFVCLLAFLWLAWRNPFAGPWTNDLRLFVHLVLLQSWVPDSKFVLDFNGVAWSISTEMAFYFAFPLLLLVRQRTLGVLYTLIGVFSVVGALVANSYYRADPAQVETINAMLHFNPLFRIFEFATGMMVGRLFLSGAHQRLARFSLPWQSLIEVAALAGIVASYLFFHRWGVLRKWIDIDEYRPIVHWLAKGTGSVLAFAIVVWVFSWSRGVIGKLLSRRWFVYLGEISFAFYLVHQLIQVEVKTYGNGLRISPLVAIPTSLALALAFSALLYAVVEVPSKEALLALADRKWTKARRILTQVPLNAWRSGVLPIAIASVLAALITLELDLKSTLRLCSDPVAIRQVVSRSRPEFRGVVFEEEARLHGLVCEQVAEGARIRMVWEVLPGRTRSRFIHICDKNGKVLRQSNAHGDPFSQAVPRQLWIEEVLVENSKLIDAASIGIGFFSRERKAARVSQGPRSMSNHRLDVMNLRAESAAQYPKTIR